MSNNSNIRDFRNAGVAEASDNAEKSNRAFYSFVIAIPVIAVVAGLGYKPLMNLRGNNLAAAEASHAEYEEERRANNPMYAMMSNVNSDGLIDLNPKPPTGAAKTRKDLARRALNADEFLNRIDAKASNFSPLEMETLKYTRATWALTTCGHKDLQTYYMRTNTPKYEKLKAIADAAQTERRDARMAQAEKLEIPKIENKTQALAFVASGGVGRHQKNAMNMMSDMSSIMGDSGKFNIKSRRQRFNKKGCMRVRTIVQSGSLNVKTNIRLTD